MNSAVPTPSDNAPRQATAPTPPEFPIPGLHHVTAIARNARENVVFYADVLGLRLVKKTVNFDDPGTYHLYYGDAVGSPGSIMTFFPWGNAHRGALSTGQVSFTSFGVAPEALAFWQRRLQERGLAVESLEVFGEPVLRFHDHDLLGLELVGAVQPGDPRPAWATPEISTELAIRGFEGVTLFEKELEGTARLLEVLGYQRSAEESTAEGRRVRFEAPGKAPGHRLDVLVPPRGAAQASGRVAAGSIHHIALRVANDDAQRYWQQRLAAAGFWPTEIKDRQYFHSIYFREPGGVLFELATDPPGFSFDEKTAELGRSLKLPPWLEPRRAEIEAELPPLPEV